MIDVVNYSPEHEPEWNSFVQKAKNGHFMFNRQYMQYHGDRFKDRSLLFFKGSKLIALLPAHEENNMLISHGGLTFGGLLTDCRMTLKMMQRIWHSVVEHIQENSLSGLHYKPVPTCYHTTPASEDIPVLLQFGAKALLPDVLSVIDLGNRPRYYKGIRHSIQKANRARLAIKRSRDIEQFHRLLSTLLEEKFAAKPIHSIEELQYLLTQFPANIFFYGVYNPSDVLVAGIILYVNINVVHTQYIGANEEGKINGAVPFLLNSLILEYQETHQYLSLGTSRGGDYVNESLYQFKESLGARAMLQEQYLLEV